MTINFFSLFQAEKARLDNVLAGRQDGPLGPALQVPLTVVGALLGLGVGSLLVQPGPEIQRLEDHPMCGITTGGQVRNKLGLQLGQAQVKLN